MLVLKVKSIKVWALMGIWCKTPIAEIGAWRGRVRGGGGGAFWLDAKSGDPWQGASSCGGACMAGPAEASRELWGLHTRRG